MQIAGLKFTGTWNGNSWTLSDVKVLGGNGAFEDLVDSQIYNCVTNAYIIEGNGGRNIIKDGAQSDPTKSDTTVAELMSKYFTENSPVAPPAIDDRENLVSSASEVVHCF